MLIGMCLIIINRGKWDLTLMKMTHSIEGGFLTVSRKRYCNSARSLSIVLNNLIPFFLVSTVDCNV